MDAMIPVVNRKPGKLWAWLQFPVSRFLIASAALVGWAGLMTAGTGLSHLPPGGTLVTLFGFVFAAGVPVIYTYYVWLVEQRPAVELELDGAVRHLARGILLGAVLFCLSMLVLKLLGAWRYAGLYPLGTLYAPFMTAMLGAVLTQALVCGVLFRMVEESLGSWVALAAAALVYALFHLITADANILSTFATALEGGILMTAAYMFTRSLWFVMGLQFGRLFTEGGVFAANVAGGKPTGVIGVDFTGSPLLTGGDFGPEASLTAVLISLALGIAFIVLAVRNGKVVKPFWNRK